MAFDMNPADKEAHGECRHKIESLRATVQEQEEEMETLARPMNYEVKLKDMYHGQIFDLRQQTKILEDKVEEWRNESMNLRQQLAAADNEVEFRVAQVEEKCLTINALQEQLAATNEVICVMKKVLERFASGTIWSEVADDSRSANLRIMDLAKQILSSVLTCPHKEEADLNKKLYKETQEVYAFSVKTENDLRDQLAVSKEEVERLLDKCASLRLCNDKDIEELIQAREALKKVNDRNWCNCEYCISQAKLEAKALTKE